MAGETERRIQFTASLGGQAKKNENIDAAIEELIDELIVPYLIEEFLRLHQTVAMINLTDEIRVGAFTQS